MYLISWETTQKLTHMNCWGGLSMGATKTNEEKTHNLKLHVHGIVPGFSGDLLYVFSPRKNDPPKKQTKF